LTPPTPIVTLFIFNIKASEVSSQIPWHHPLPKTVTSFVDDPSFNPIWSILQKQYEIFGNRFGFWNKPTLTCCLIVKASKNAFKDLNVWCQWKNYPIVKNEMHKLDDDYLKFWTQHNFVRIKKSFRKQPNLCWKIYIKRSTFTSGWTGVREAAGIEFLLQISYE